MPRSHYWDDGHDFILETAIVSENQLGMLSDGKSTGKYYFNFVFIPAFHKQNTLLVNYVPQNPIY